jgi:type III secretion protein J
MRRNHPCSCTALFVLVVVALGGCVVPVQHGMDENAANEVVSALGRVNIGAQKERDEGTGTVPTFMVKVGRDDAGRALELLRSLGLPRSQRSGMAEMYNQPSLVPSATEERARFLEALGNEIERSLETVEGVVSARVHIVPSETDPLSVDAKPRVPAQAAVLLKTRAGGTPALKEADIQRLVAASVPGLTPPAVAVVLTTVPEWSGASGTTMVDIGPIRISRGSRGLLMAAFASLLAVVALLAIVLLFTARRLAAVQRAVSARRA